TPAPAPGKPAGPFAWGNQGDRELPVGLLLVLGGVRPVRAPYAVEPVPVVVPPGADHPVVGLDGVGAELDRDRAVEGLEVSDPLRIRGGAACAAGDDVRIAVGRRDERVDELLARLAARGVQQEGALALPVTAEHTGVGPEVLDH